MMHITKEQQPLYQQLQQIEAEMRTAAEKAKVYENSLMILQRTIKRNELTVKQLETVPLDRAVYIPLGRAFMKRNKEQTIKQISKSNSSLGVSIEDMEKNIKVYTEKANDKYKVLKEGTERLMKKKQ